METFNHICLAVMLISGIITTVHGIKWHDEIKKGKKGGLIEDTPETIKKRFLEYYEKGVYQK